MNKLRGIFLKVWVALIVCIALAFVGKLGYDLYKVKQADRQGVEELQELVDNIEGVPETDKVEWVYKGEEIENPYEVVRVEDDTEGAPIGYVSFPSIGKVLTLREGYGGENTYRGMATNYKGYNFHKGNTVLMSHYHYDGKSLLARLEEVQPGSEIFVVNNDKVYRYKVEWAGDIEPTEDEWLQETSQPVLTIYSCTPEGDNRVIRRAGYIGEKALKDLSRSELDKLGLKD